MYCQDREQDFWDKLLVISRRHPKLATQECADDPTVDEWAVTVVREEEPSNKSGEVINSEFTYLAPVGADATPRKGEVLKFRADTMPLMPIQNEPYARQVEWGTAIKLYEYKTTVSQSNIIWPDCLLYAIERLLPEIGLPVRLHECRKYGGAKERSFETAVSGLVVRLEEGRGDNLEPGFPLSAPLNAAGAKMTARIYAFKEDKASTYLKDEGVIFSMNGQAHGYLPKTIFTRPKRVALPRLRDSLLVLVDCSSLTVRQRQKLFMTSRDRLSKEEIRYEVEREVEQMLKNHKILRRLQQERREQDVESKLSEEKPLEEVIGKVLKASPTLQALFLKGQRLSKPFAGSGGGENGGEEGGPQKNEETQKPFKGRRHPTYFKVADVDYGKLYRRDCEEGRRCRIAFKTDVENEYFDRATDQGSFELEILDSGRELSPLNHSLSLEDGDAHLNLALAPEAKVGDRIVLQATVTDPIRVEPFVNYIQVSVKAKHDRPGGNGKKKKKTGKGTGQQESQSGITLPKMISVKTDDEHWRRHKFSGHTACHVESDPVTDKDGKEQLAHTFYINVHNDALRTEMKYSKKQDSKLVEAKFKYGNVLLGLAMLHDEESDNAHGKSNRQDESESIQNRIRSVTEAVAPVLLPMIDQLSGLDEVELEEIGMIGEDG